MDAYDALALLKSHFTLVRAGMTPAGEEEYDFVTPFAFTAVIVEQDELRLMMPLDPDRRHWGKDVLRAALEASLQGRQTGSGRMALDPVLGLVLADSVTCDETLTATALQMRFVDFSLFGEYWRSEKIAALADAPAERALAPADEQMILRI